MAKKKNPPQSPFEKGSSKKQNRQALEAPQTSELGWLSTDFQEHPVRGLTPAKLHQLLTEAESGYLTAQADLFCDMEERDTHLFSEIDKRKRAVLCLDWYVRAKRNASAQEEKIALEIQEWLEDLKGFKTILKDALDAIGHGYSCQEIEWERLGSLWLPKTIEHILPRHFMTPVDAPNELRLACGSGGEELLDFGWIVHKAKAKTGYVARSGLHRVLSWPFLFKNYSVRDLMEFLEIYGLPQRIGKYPSGATNEEKHTLLRAVMMLGRNAGGIIPNGMSIDFEECAKGTSDPHMAMIKWCELSQSKAILGSTLTSQADGQSSTNALGKVHNEVRWELTESDAEQLAGSLNDSLINYYMRLNYPNITPDRYPDFCFDLSQPEDLGIFAEALPKLVEIGMKIPVAWAHEKLSIPLQADDEDILGVKAKDNGVQNLAINRYTPNLLNTSMAINSVQLPLEDQAMQLLIKQQMDLAQQTTEQWTHELIAKIRAGKDEQEILAVLSDIYPSDDEPALQEKLTKLIFAGEVLGRISIEAEQS